MLATSSGSALQRMRARALGIRPGVLAPGPYNAITDVSGVRVGQVTVQAGDSVPTGPGPWACWSSRTSVAIG
ncbi:MAG: hypothetical protein ACREOF_05775 [Gemmatimonadales bacterium]